MSQVNINRSAIVIALATCLASGCSIGGLETSRSLNPLAAANSPSTSLAGTHPPQTDKRVDRKLARPVDAAQSAEACLVTARTFKQQGLTGDAIAMFERARKHQPEILGISRDLAVLYDRAGEYFKAEREYKAALIELPNNVDLINDYGFFHYQRSQYDEAVTQFRHAIEIQPKHERAMTNLGMTLAKQSNFDQAEAMFAQVSGPAAAAYNIALLQANAGDTDLAMHKCQQALDLQPTLEPAQKLVSQLAQGAFQ